MQIIILAAGRGSRFDGSEFHKPKPMITWEGKSMIEHTIENFKGVDVDIILIKRHEIIVNVPDVKMIDIDYITDGPACTAYLAKDSINMGSELIIVNCDQVILDWNMKSQELQNSTWFKSLGKI